MPLHHVDPTEKRGRFYQANVRFARSPIGQFLARHVTPRIDPWLREVQLTYFHDGSNPILIASNYGEAKNPQWYHNLTAHPECQFGDEHFVATEVTSPAEYERLYGLAEQVYPGYVDYRLKTAASGRRIPVFRLDPR